MPLAVLVAGWMICGPVAAAENAVPDMSGNWGRNTFDLEAMPSSPHPVTNLIRLPEGSSDPTRPAGDYRNPVLRPRAADMVKRRAESALAGVPMPDLSSQCAPFPPPYVSAMQLRLQFIQSANEVTLVYEQDEQVRHVRLNASHPTHPAPSWMGDSVGHYEGGTLVIDTIGIKTGPLAMVDRYGTPFSPALHVVERFSLIGAVPAKDAAERHEKEAGHLGQTTMFDAAYPKGLNLIMTIEDPAMFTAPWSAQINYRRIVNAWQEQICAENRFGYYTSENTPIPSASRPGF